MTPRRETPYKRTYADGRVRWVARYTGSDGIRRYAKPAWNRGSASFELKRDAQRAIDEAYGLPLRPDTVGAFAKAWQQPHRGERTAETNEIRIRRILDLSIDGRPLRDWPLGELRRRHMELLVDALFTKQGRSPQGVVNMLRALSVLFEDAIALDCVDVNPVKGVRVRSSDRRAKKENRPARVFSWEHLRRFAAAGRPEARAALKEQLQADGKPARFGTSVDYEPMLRTFTDTNLRLGEVLALRRADFAGDVLHVRGNAHRGRITEGDTREKHHVRDVPCPPSLAKLIRGMVPRIDTEILFPAPRGGVFHERVFYRDVWGLAQLASGLDIRPHECRHSWITHLRAEGIDDADLAEMAGHRVETMLQRYTHPLGQSFDAVREAIG